MDRLRRLGRRRSRPPAYEPLPGGSESLDGEPIEGTDVPDSNHHHSPFSWVDYAIFLLLGVAMLWAWNMFLAAAPYFQRRFRKDEWILTHFQSAILSVSTVANLGSMIVLTKLQAKASYPKRIVTSLLLNVVIFTLLASSTRLFRGVTPAAYLVFLLTMVFAASLATGLSQNGVFAYVSGFGREEYTQAIMTGQAIAGVLPCIAQIVSVLSVQTTDDGEETSGGGQKASTSAMSYFLTATGVSTLALLAFLYLLPRHRAHKAAKRLDDSLSNAQDSQPAERRVIGMWTLFIKLRWLATAVFLCFGVTMFFPVFTQAILSVQPTSPSQPRLLQPATFIPLAFLFWNTGDLFGRLSTLLSLPISFPFSNHRPKLLFIFSILRLLFIPLYLLCNIRGRGAVIPSDFFYLCVVQFGFGLSNGWLGSECMMGAADLVDAEEREAAGGFMGLALVAGLTVGSLLSFLAGSV